MNAERPKFTKQYNYKIGNEITLRKDTDPRARKITDEVRAGIILIVSKAINAEKFDQILRLATVADRLNARRGMQTTVAQRVSSYFADMTPTDLEEEKKTKHVFRQAFINMQSSVATELSLAIYNGDIDIAYRYCSQITKKISHEIQDNKERKFDTMRSSLL